MPDEQEREYQRYDRYRTDITFREALDMFASKESVAGLTAAIASQGAQIQSVVSRKEHEARWLYEDQRYKAIEDRNRQLDSAIDGIDKKVDIKFEKLDTKLNDLNSRLPPKWLYPLLSIVVPVLLVLVQYLLHTQVPQAAPH